MPHLASRRRPLIGRGARRLLPAFSLDGLRPCQNAESHQESHPGGFLSRFKALTRLRLRALGLAMLPIFGHGDDISSLTSIFPAIMCTVFARIRYRFGGGLRIQHAFLGAKHRAETETGTVIVIAV